MFCLIYLFDWFEILKELIFFTKKITKCSGEIVNVFIAIVTSVVKPENQAVLKFLPEGRNSYWSSKFIRRLPFWIPYVLVKIKQLFVVLSQNKESQQNAAIEEVSGFLRDVKLLCATRLSKITSTLIKSINVLCNPNVLKQSPSGLIYSSYGELYVSISMNLVTILEVAFKAEDSKNSVFFKYK